MTRRLTLVAIGVALLAALLWLAWSARQQSVDDIVLSLRVNGGMHADIERGEPLRYEVFLTGRSPGAQVTVGSSSQPWAALITLRADNKDGKEQREAPVVLSQPRRLTVAANAGGTTPVDEADGSIARVDGRRHLFVTELGLAPDVTARLTPGPYRYLAVLSVKAWDPWSAAREVRSASVTVTVKEPTDGGETARLERTARFHIHARQYQEARALADTLIARHAANPSGHILLGDALKGQGDPRSARAAYIKALEMIRAGRQFYEDHDTLFASIRETEKALVGAKRHP